MIEDFKYRLVNPGATLINKNMWILKVFSVSLPTVSKPP